MHPAVLVIVLATSSAGAVVSEGSAPAVAPVVSSSAASRVPITSAASPPAAASAPAPAAANTYTYQAENRRDPFLSLIGNTGVEARAPVTRSPGPAGLMVNEIALRGIVTSKGALLGMIQGPDKRTYLVRAGDKLFDGSIKSITPQGLVIVQQFKDPLSVVTQREVRKSLRPGEEPKP